MNLHVANHIKDIKTASLFAISRIMPTNLYLTSHIKDIKTASLFSISRIMHTNLHVTNRIHDIKMASLFSISRIMATNIHVTSHIKVNKDSEPIFDVSNHAHGSSSHIKGIKAIDLHDNSNTALESISQQSH